MKRRILFGEALNRLAILLAAIGWLGCGSTVWAETITGTFRYADFNPANGSTTNRPIQFCRVEIHTFRTRNPFPLNFPTWGFELATTTDGNGSISVQSFQLPGAGIKYKVAVFAQNYAAVVLANNFAASGPFWQEPGYPDGAAIERTLNLGTDILDFSYDFTDGFTPQHWSLADAVRYGFDYVAARRDPNETDSLPVALVHPGLPAPLTTFYNPVTETLAIQNIHVWEDFTVLHEYAHFVEHHIGIFAVIPAIHDGCTARDIFGGIINTAEHAWMEGFAEFFAQAVAANNPPGTFRGFAGGNGTFTVAQLEATPWANCTGLPGNVTPGMIEHVVAGVLWDVFDAPGACFSSETHDALSGLDTAVIQILDNELDHLAHAPTIGDFSTAWSNRGLPPLFDILFRHGLAAPLPPPSLICLGDITVPVVAGSCTAVVTFPTPVLNLSRRCAVVQCNPASGFAFPIGTTTVNCSATENGAVVATCSFNVTVQPDPSLPIPNGTGLLGIYYDNLDFTSPRVARTEEVNFDWGLGAPAPGVDADTFSVRWTGKVVPRHSDFYQFFTVSDDGVRLWVDGRLIVSEWNDHGPTEHYGNLFLEAGQAYDVVLEMYENGGGAVAKLLWQSGCQPKELIPASHLLPARLDCPTPDRPTFSVNFVQGIPPGAAMFGQAAVDAGWLKLTTPATAFGIVHIDNFSGTQPVHGFEAKFTAALFGSTCCGGGALPADGFSFNLVPAASVLANPGYNQPGEEGLDEGLAVNFDTWDNGAGEGPAVEVKWRGQVVKREPFQASQSPAGITTARAAAREVLINLASDGRLTVSYGGIRVLDSETPYTPLVIGTPKWVIGARNGGANDNHWIRDLQIVVNRAKIPELFNTGVDNLSRPLTEDVGDPHYVFSVVGGPPMATFVATSAGGFPIGPWLPDNTVSAWISPTTNTLAPQDFNILYETTFNLRGLNPVGAAIYGWIAADNQLVDILLNSQSTGQATPVAALGGEPFTSRQAFAITSGFLPGANTLTFVTRNGTGGENPTGLRVEMCGWATPPPLLHLNIASDSLRTTVSWGSLPHKQYILEHTDNLSGPWAAGAGFRPNAYQAQIVEDYRHVPRDPIQFYRVVEAFAAAPGNPTVSGTPANATVSWVPAAGASGYSVERWSQVNPNCCRTFSPLLPANATSWADSNYPLEGSYTFRVTALHPNGTHGVVEVGWVRPTPQDPAGFSANHTGGTTVELTWQPVPGVTRYLVSGPGVTNAEPVSGTTLSVAGVPAGLQTWMVFSLYEPGGVFTHGVLTSAVLPGQVVLSGWVDLHTHPMINLAFGGKLVHGGVDVGSLLPQDTSCQGTNRATSMAHALGDDRPSHGGHNFFTFPCGDELRKIIIEAFQQGNNAFTTAPQALGFPSFDQWPRWNDITHQKMWFEWIRRARDGGLRVMVALATNNKTLADGLKGPGDNLPTDDKGSADLQITEIKAFVARHNDFMEVALNAADIKRIVQAGKIAVVLGVEIDNIGNFNTFAIANLPVDVAKLVISVEIQRLYDSGVRYIFPVHVLDNAFGGSAIYKEGFNTSNLREAGHYWDIECADVADSITFTYKESDDLGGNVLRDAGAFIKLGLDPFRHSGPGPICSPGVGHRNARGLTDLGVIAIKEMMKRGMIVDIDHMSHKTADATLDLAETFGYPVVSGHTGIRGLAGSDAENSRTRRQLQRLSKLHGMFGLGSDGAQAKQWSQLYQQAMFEMGYRDPDPAKANYQNGAVSFGTDLNGLVMGPRPGGEARITYDAAFPMSSSGIKFWDYNTEGVAHYGMLPDFIRDVRTTASIGYIEPGWVPRGITGPELVDDHLFRSADYFWHMWERIEAQKVNVH